MKRIIILLILALGIGCSTTTAAQRGDAAKNKQRDWAVRSARFLESNPFDDKAKETRERLTAYMIRVPDITVNMCGDLIPEMYEKRTRMILGHAEILAQLGFGALAAVLQHPEIARDRYAQDLAGVESALKVYKAVLLRDPTAKRPYLDDLIAQRDAGTLADEIKTRTDKCIKIHAYMKR